MLHEIKDDKYHVVYNHETAIISLEGSLMLNGAIAYEPILNLLKYAAEQQEPNALILDIRSLKFVNSSGINMLTKFIMYIVEIKELKITITLHGLQNVAWQKKLSVNLRRLMQNFKENLE